MFLKPVPWPNFYAIMYVTTKYTCTYITWLNVYFSHNVYVKMFLNVLAKETRDVAIGGVGVHESVTPSETVFSAK
jgi:hypothetical protein